jgi:hypothetical protein
MPETIVSVEGIQKFFDGPFRLKNVSANNYYCQWKPTHFFNDLGAKFALGFISGTASKEREEQSRASVSIEAADRYF